MKKENKKKEQETVSKVDKKQLIVGIIILIIAILTLAYAFMGMGDKAATTEETATVTEVTAPETPAAKAEAKAEPKVEAKVEQKAAEEKKEVAAKEEKEKPHVFLSFTATAEKDLEYVISYTTEKDPYFNGKNVVTQPIKKGTENYKVEFPVEKVVSFRLDMGIDSGKMTVKNIKFVGSQEEDISNPMYYEIMGKIEVVSGNSFVINEKQMPTLIYHPEFKAEVQPKAAPKAEVKAEAKAEAKAEPKVEAKPEAKAEPKAEAKDEPKAEEKAAK